MSVNDGKDMNIASYITTGALVPDWANTVVKIEDTEQVDVDANGTSTSTSTSDSNEKFIRIKVNSLVGENIRQIGSDIGSGEVVLKKGA